MRGQAARLLAGVLALALPGCASTSSRFPVLGHEVEVATRQGESHDQVKGELLAVSPDLVLVLGPKGIRKVPRPEIERVRVRLHDLDGRKAGIWVVAGALGLYKESGEMQNNIEYTVGTFEFGKPQRVAKAAECPACPAPVAKKVAPVLVVLEDTHFEYDSARLTKDGATILDGNIQILRASPKTNVRIAGYTSASGTQDYNQKLSERRATAVRDYLIAGGISQDRLTKIGYGETRPAQYEPVPENIYTKEAKSNMRVLFEVIVK